MMGDFDNFFHLTVEAFKIAFRPEHVARCYRNLGFYFVEKQLYPEAIACYLLSLRFEKECKHVQSELYYIKCKTDGKVKEPSLKEARKYAEKYGFPINADDDIIGLAYIYGKHFFQENVADAARYYLNIAYALTDDDDVRKMLDTLPDNSQEN